MGTKWHTSSLSEIETLLKTDLADGLSIRESRVRLEAETRNDGGERHSLFVPAKGNYIKTALSFFISPAIIILIVISLLASIFGSMFTGFSVLGISVIGAVIGGLISQSAQRRLDSMNEYASPMVKVLHGGNKFYTDGRNLVKGDIIMLSQGDLLPCDARIITSDSLEVKELIWTKEGIRNRVVKKDHSKTYEIFDAVAKADAENMLYAGSAVISGDAIAVVIATGRDVYLSKYVSGGALAGREDPDEGVNIFKPTMYRISFVCISLLAILSLLSLVTLRDTSFVANFLMMLSSVALISLETLRLGYRHIFSARIEKMSRFRLAKKKKDKVAHIRGMKSIETITKLTDVVLLGRAALCDGVCHVGEAYIAGCGGRTVELTPQHGIGNRLLTCINTYLKALNDSGIEDSLVLDGVADALYEYLHSSGFDISGALYVLRSLYYAGDPSGKSGYACADTVAGAYRVTLTFDESILQKCRFSRAEYIKNIDPITSDDINNLISFCRKTEDNGGKCLYIVSESDGETVLEGVISLFEHEAEEIVSSIEDLNKMGINTTAMLLDDINLIYKGSLARVFSEGIAYASDFKENGNDILHRFGEYRAYVGFSADEYAELISHMRKEGRCVAAYGVDNDYYDAMSRADIAVSCDVIRYSSQKYRESVYERLPCDGRDTNIRCSQRTRLLSKVLVHRTHAGGGGLLPVVNAIRRSRGAYISFSMSLLLFAILMCTLVPVTAMSALLGLHLLNAVQTAALSIIGALLSMLAFAESETKQDILDQKTDFSAYPSKILKTKFFGLTARVLVTCLLAGILKILDLMHVFGDKASYTMPVFIGMLFVAAAELLAINIDFTQRGDGRRRAWMSFLIAYAMVLFVGGVITQFHFAAELFPNGIGTWEFLIIPIYWVMYFIVVAGSRLYEKRGKNA